MISGAVIGLIGGIGLLLILSALTTDPELASLRGLYQLVRGLRDIPTEQVQFLTVPREPYVYDSNRDQLVEGRADALFALLRADKPVPVTKKNTSSSEDSEASGFHGNTAAEDSCG